MRRSPFFVASVCALSFAAIASASTEAKAAEEPAATPPNAASASEKPKEPEDDDRFRPLALTANPLSLALGRIGLNVEYMLARHHGIMLNPFGQFTSVGDEGTASGKTSYTNFGAELGYHFYTGSRGANGFFVGPSLVFIQSSSTTKATAGGVSAESTGSFSAYGGAVDLGGQHVFQNGITIGGGFGLMYLTSSATASSTNTSSTVKFDGVLPRFLLTAGYSF